MSMTTDNLRLAIDKAIDAWLKANGLTSEQIGNLDYSSIDDELNYLVENIKE